MIFFDIQPILQFCNFYNVATDVRMDGQTGGQNDGQTDRMMGGHTNKWMVMQHTCKNWCFFSRFCDFYKSITNGPTDRRTNGPTDGRTHLLIESWLTTKKCRSAAGLILWFSSPLIFLSLRSIYTWVTELTFLFQSTQFLANCARKDKRTHQYWVVHLVKWGMFTFLSSIRITKSN